MFQPSYVDPKTNQVQRYKFPLQCIFLKMFGSWPTKSPNDDEGITSAQRTIAKGYKIYSAAVIFLIFITCCAQSFFVFSKWGDLLTVTECGCTVFMGIHNLLRCLHLNWKRDAMKGIIEEFLRNVFVPRYFPFDLNYISMIICN